MRVLRTASAIGLAAAFAAGRAAPSAVVAADFPSGAQIFNDRCASCHGADGTGSGPLASTLGKHPADLTIISRRNNGQFPAARVVEIITYGGNIGAHGESPMPVWGRIFSSEGGSGKIGAAASRRNLIALKRYIESIQK